MFDQGEPLDCPHLRVPAVGEAHLYGRASFLARPLAFGGGDAFYHLRLFFRGICTCLILFCALDWMTVPTGSFSGPPWRTWKFSGSGLGVQAGGGSDVEIEINRLTGKAW